MIYLSTISPPLETVVNRHDSVSLSHFPGAATGVSRFPEYPSWDSAHMALRIFRFNPVHHGPMATNYWIAPEYTTGQCELGFRKQSIQVKFVSRTTFTRTK